MSRSCYLLYDNSIALVLSMQLCYVKMCEIDANLWQVLGDFMKIWNYWCTLNVY